MTEIKTQKDVLENARLVFETAPFLVDLVVALCDRNRVCTIAVNLDKDHKAFNMIEWPVE